MRTLTSKALHLHSYSLSPTFLSHHFLLFHSNTNQEIHKKRVGISSSSHSSQSSSSSSLSYRHHDEEIRNVKVSVWWDFENCSVPVGVNVYKITHQITSALRSNGIKGPVTITAFGDVLQMSRSNLEALSSTGICLTHVPRGGKNSADRSLLVDLVYWVSQNPPPAHLFLISGDRDFANILHRLRMNNYNILLASKESAPGVLCSAASIMWPWNGLVRGDTLTGKHFNHPPDGVYGSWYGHYKGPLDDPFVDTDHPTCSQFEDSSEPGTELKTPPIPKTIVNRIRLILKSYPKGISLSDLRLELAKKKVYMDKEFFGYKKFSRFLLSMPNILRLQHPRLGEGQPLVHGIHGKSTTLVDSSQQLSAAVETTDRHDQLSDNQPLAFDVHPKPTALVDSNQQLSAGVETTDRHDQLGDNQPLAFDVHLKSPQPFESNLKSSTRLEVTNGHKDHPISIDANEKSSVTPFQSKREELSLGREEIDTCNAVVNSTLKLERDSIAEEGFLQRIWRTWFVRRSHPDLLGSTSSSFDVRKSVLEDKAAMHSEINDDKPPSKSGLLNQFVRWCQFWKTREESPAYNSGFSNQTKDSQHTDECESVTPMSRQLENLDLFLKYYFWNDLESFLNTRKALALISRSRTREQLVKELQKDGPSILKSLHANHFHRLLDMLISERKWVDECSSQTFPFKLMLPAKTKCINPSQARDSNGLHSIFLGTPQPHLQRLPEHGLEKREHTPGPVATENVNPKQPQSLAELKVWLQKFRNGTGKIEVEDFMRHFEREFNGKIDCGFYGCSTVGNLLASCSSNDDNSGKGGKDPSNMSRLEIIADCQELLAEMLKKNPGGFNMGTFKPTFLERYGYNLDHQMLGYSKLAYLLLNMPGVPGVKSGSTFILPAEKVPMDVSPEKSATGEMLGKVTNLDVAESTGRNIGPDPPAEQDSVWEELGPVSEGFFPRTALESGLDDTGLVSEMGVPGDDIEPGLHGKSNEELDKQVDFNELLPFSDEEFSDSEGENPDVDRSKGQDKHKNSDEDSSLLQILDSWYSTKDGSKDQLNVDEFADGSKSNGSKPSSSSGVGAETSLGMTNRGLKLKSRKSYSFVSEPIDDKEKLIDSILVSLKKSDSKMQS
ncbi:putative endonuclease or glycosyl hydrolase [Tasmannia lanceolata]|uniref:putative endonuclease or glycosyl hydrolase n=1 Tax=Tasmannia lanceolata TaxID=3420 RepID=UPI0040640BAC